MRTDTIETAAGSSLEIIIEGAGDDVLIYHHGTPAAGPVEAELLAAATTHNFTIVQVVRPGYGASTRQMQRSVADVVPLVQAAISHVTGAHDNSFVTLGWSGGGPHALATAALMPSCASSVSFAGVGPFDAQGLDFLAGMGEDNVVEFGAAVTGPEAVQEFMNAVMPGMQEVTGAEVTAEMASLLPAADMEFLAGGYADAFAATLRYSLAQGPWGWADDDIAFVNPWGFDLGSIRTPAHIWQGGDDLMVPFAHGCWLAENVPTAISHLMDGEGHLSLARRFSEVVAGLRADFDSARRG